MSQWSLYLSLKYLFIITRLTRHLLECCWDQCFAFQVNFCQRVCCFYLWMFTVTNFLDGDKDQCDNAFSRQLISLPQYHQEPLRELQTHLITFGWISGWNIHIFFHSNVKTVADYWFICYIYKKKTQTKQNKQKKKQQAGASGIKFHFLFRWIR